MEDRRTVRRFIVPYLVSVHASGLAEVVDCAAQRQESADTKAAEIITIIPKISPAFVSAEFFGYVEFFPAYKGDLLSCCSNHDS